MIAQKYHELPVFEINEERERRVIYTDHLMLAIIDFADGPHTEPDPPHSHPHEQVTYIAEGEILFIMDGQQMHLCQGDVFSVPSGKPHSIQLLTPRARLVDCFTPIREDFIG